PFDIHAINHFQKEAERVNGNKRQWHLVESGHLWSAPAERGDGAFPRTERFCKMSTTSHASHLPVAHRNCFKFNVSRARSCLVVGMGERHDRPGEGTRQTIPARNLYR